MQKTITFTFERQRYRVGLGVLSLKRIVLPDKRVLKVTRWSQCEVPVPLEFEQIRHRLQLTAEEIAAYYGAVGALQILEDSAKAN